MKRRITKKRLLVGSIVAAMLLGGGVAFAFFSATGTGAGAAKSGHAAKLLINEIGAGYDSLISTNSYIQDQTFSGAGITEFGNHVTLAGTTAEQLVTVVVAIRNWGPAVAQTLTFTITNTVAGPVTDTQHVSFPAAIVTEVTPSETNVDFDFASQGAVIDHSLLYSISGLSGPLNVALSNSYNDLLVGSDTTPGYVWVKATGSGFTTLGHDFPACSPPVTLGVYEKVDTSCGPQSATNPGAYGTTTEVQNTGNADIPAVDINVVGGIAAPALYPGGPAAPVNFAITNPGQTSVHVGTVTTSITGLSGEGTTTSIPACTALTYALNIPTVPVGENVPPGTTLFNATGTSVYLKTSGTTQDNCQTAVVKLGFASS